jgi:dihydrofolate synthase/folylpolyglutamate synthase
LGNTLQAIAREKAGIIKPGVPVVSGVSDEEPRDEIRRIAKERGSPIIETETDFRYEYAPPKHLEQSQKYGILSYVPLSTEFRSATDEEKDIIGEKLDEDNAIFSYELSLLGRHQAQNAAVALATIFELRRQGWAISENALRQGLREAAIPARVEIIERQPAVILDSAHNPASIAALIETVGESFTVGKRHLIFAATKDKDNRAMMRLLTDAFDSIYLTRYTTNPRFVPPEELAAIGYELKEKNYPTFPTPQEAWEFAKRNASPEDLICITGSFFLAGELRKILT